MANIKPTNTKKKMSGPSLAALIVTIAILFGLVVSLLAGTGLFVRIRKGASSEHFKVNGSMMSYYANSYYQNWYSQYYYYIMFGMIKFDPNASFKDQLTTDGKTTYYDYFVNGTKSTVDTYLKYCEEAMVDPDVNYGKLEEEAKQYAKESIDSLREAAKQNSTDLKSYIRQYFGQYISVNDLKKALVIEHIASDYYEIVHDRKFDAVDSAREDKYFADHLSEFVSAEYLIYTLSSTVTAEKVDETKFEGGKNSQEYKDAVAAAEAKAKEANEKAKLADKEKLDKLATATTLEEFKTMFLEFNYDKAFKSTYDTAVKNFASTDKPSTEALEAYKSELKDKVIAAVVEGLDDLPKEEEDASTPETAADVTPVKTKWEKAQETFPKSLIAALKKVITDNTKTISYTLESDLGKFFFAGVKDQYKIDYKEGEEKGTNAPLYDHFFDDTEYTADADKNIGKYSMSLYFVTEEAHRDDYILRDVGHILFKVDEKGTNGAYKTSAEAKKAAEELYEKIKAELVDGKISKEKFEEFAKVTQDSSVFYDDVPKGKMSDEFEDWLYSDERKEAGEIGLVETEHGWHIMYYGGETEAAWRNVAHDGATDEDMDEWFKALTHNVTINDKIFEKIFNK